MNLGFQFFFVNLSLGVALAADAFSVSLANGLNEPCMRTRKACGIAAIFALFQGVMPMLGWICIHTLLGYFQAFEPFIPWIALALLGFIGGKMLYDGIKGGDCECECVRLGLVGLLVQGVATSIDALSVGFTIAEYNLPSAILAATLIALVTFIICAIGVLLGRKMGTKLAGKATILGGAILIVIGLEIFITGVFC